MSSLRAALDPQAWDRTFSGAPNLCSAGTPGLNGALLRRWHGTAADMEQPALDHHYVTLHLLGAKRIVRRGDGAAVSVDAEDQAITLVPAGTNYSWTTFGPIGFAHLYLAPALIDRVSIEEFDREPRSIELIDFVGRRLPLVKALMAGMIDELESPTFASRLVLGSLLHSLVVRLLSECSTLKLAGSPAHHSIAPRRLQRVLEFIEANLTTEIELADLASVAGSSRFHFCRAFREATGLPPYRYVLRRRIEFAKALLLGEKLSIGQIAGACGFNSRSQFAAMFRREFGTSPSRFRRDH